MFNYKEALDLTNQSTRFAPQLKIQENSSLSPIKQMKSIEQTSKSSRNQQNIGFDQDYGSQHSSLNKNHKIRKNDDYKEYKNNEN